jgi:hypothetical protein
VPRDFKIRIADELFDIAFLAGEKIVEADHIHFFAQQTLAKMTAQKSGAAGDQNARS